MTNEQIKQLLEKYWAGDTSVEEERTIKTFFSGDSISEEFRKYQPLFSWKAKQLQLKAKDTLKTGFETHYRFQCYSFLKIAASVFLALTLGTGFYTQYQQEKQMDRIFSETYSNPEDALKETTIVIGKVSSALNLAKDKQDEMQKYDSLEHTSKSNKLE